MPCVRRQCVAEHALIYTAVQCFDNRGRGAEVHVRDPKRQHILATRDVPLFARRSPAWNHSVEINAHEETTVSLETAVENWYQRDLIVHDEIGEANLKASGAGLGVIDDSDLCAMKFFCKVDSERTLKAKYSLGDITA